MGRNKICVFFIFIIFFIFALYGCRIYGSLNKLNEDFVETNQFYNFNNFYSSFLISFIQLTGENWPNLMIEMSLYDPNKVNGYVAYLYFIIMNFVTYFVMINLFQMVILELYTNFNNKDEYPIEKYNDMINKFKGAWNKYSSYKEKGYRIHKRNFMNFFLDYLKVKILFI